MKMLKKFLLVTESFSLTSLLTTTKKKKVGKDVNHY